MCQYNVGLRREDTKKKKKEEEKPISVTFCILTSVLSVGQPGVQYLPSCVSKYLLRNWLQTGNPSRFSLTKQMTRHVVPASSGLVLIS